MYSTSLSLRPNISSRIEQFRIFGSLNCLFLELKGFLGELDCSYTMYNSFDTTMAFFHQGWYKYEFIWAGRTQPYQADNRSSEEQEDK